MHQQKSEYSHEEILECAEGTLFGAGNAQLPLPPMLMLDRITKIFAEGGEHGKGFALAEFDIHPDAWFFKCHFKGDPIMPGCLGLDGLWQLIGFFLGWLGLPGRGRALSVGEIKFSGMVLPTTKMIRYGINFKRILKGRLTIGLADGWVEADGIPIYKAKDLRVALLSGEEASPA